VHSRFLLLVCFSALGSISPNPVSILRAGRFSRLPLGFGFEHFLSCVTSDSRVPGTLSGIVALAEVVNNAAPAKQPTSRRVWCDPTNYHSHRSLHSDTALTRCGAAHAGRACVYGCPWKPSRQPFRSLYHAITLKRELNSSFSLAISRLKVVEVL
jgi:hypothetical protein